MTYVPALGLDLTGRINPLTGQPLLPEQVLVYGPPHTGPRATVVWMGATAGGTRQWQPWIKADASGQPYDDGTIPGGTWSGPQTLPELTTTVWGGWLWPLVIVAALYLLGRGTGRRGDW